MLDVSIRTELLRLMLDLRVDRDLTYLFITHDLSLAWVIADRVAVMYLGPDHGDRAGEHRDLGTPRIPIRRRSSRSRRRPSRRPLGRARNERILVGETPDASAIPSGCRFRTRCPLAFEKCVEEPPLIQIGEGHAAACWLAETTLPSSSPGRSASAEETAT